MTKRNLNADMSGWFLAADLLTASNRVKSKMVQDNNRAAVGAMHAVGLA